MNYYSSKTLFLMIVISTAAILVETSIGRISPFISKPINQSWDIGLFATFSFVYVVAQYIILRYLKIKSSETGLFRYESRLGIVHSIVLIVQYSLIAMLILTTTQMLIFSSYNILFLILSTAFTYILAIFLLGLLSHRFFSWFKSNRNYVVMTYGLAMAAILANAVITFILVFKMLLEQFIQYINIVSHVGSVSIFASKGSLLNSAYSISSIISFVAMWAATILLLSHYSNKIGKAKFWIIVSIPLIYFLGQFQPLFLDLFSSYRQANPTTFGIIYTIIFAISKPVGGILFGVAFWTLARTVSPNISIRAFLLISGYGLVLLFTSNQGIVIVNYPYPPFGLVAISYVGISLYLLFVGIYASAISVAHDSRLRQSIRKYVQEQSNLLGSIGTSQMEQEVQKRVFTLTRNLSDTITNDTGVQSTLTDDDIKDYTSQVIQEVIRTKSSK